MTSPSTPPTAATAASSTTPRGTVNAPVYEIALDGILISGPEAEKLVPGQSLAATLAEIGDCRIRIGEKIKGGTQAQFERPSPATIEKIEDRLWALQDANTEAVTRAMEAGRELAKIFENAVASGAVSLEDLFDTNYVEIAGSNPVQYRTKFLDWADRALPPLQEARRTERNGGAGQNPQVQQVPKQADA